MKIFSTLSLHQKCFKCSKCKRPLDYGSLAEGPDNQLYCKEWFHLIYLYYLDCRMKIFRKDFLLFSDLN